MKPDSSWIDRIRVTYRACAFDALAGSIEYQVEFPKTDEFKVDVRARWLPLDPLRLCLYFVEV